MSENLIKRWRRIARDYDQCIVAHEIGSQFMLPVDLAEAKGRALALRDCANSLECSLKRKRGKGK